MTLSVIVKIMKQFFVATNEDNETFERRLVVDENGGNTNNIPVIQPVEAIFGLASPWYPDHKVCATCHVYHVSKEKQ